ncbi:Peptidase family M28 [Carpediemonas membranifera]|uniref:Peptidase family M28 n=1 Tax=Carpediemonas membranifera TaxID=201153 RepID=A0A8J6E181_9EUKA|nr:Peptidase family M28 [Carpediemonas membranifera]|eukprot:KAG9396009.1 Peptidase family M28 [Carpediemonas membranifera]
MNRKLESLETEAVDALALTKDIIDEFGPRLAGTDACRAAARSLKDHFAKYCDTAHESTFTFAPRAFLGYFPFCFGAFLALLFSFAIAPSNPLFLGISAALLLTGLAVIILQFVYYRQATDIVYPKSQGVNIHAVMEPKGKATRQVIVSGHHDSAHIFTFLNKWQELYMFRVLGGFLSFILAVLFSVAATASAIMGYTIPYHTAICSVGAISGLFLVAPLLRFESSRVTVGAGDNLIACTIAVGIAKMFHIDRPEQTRLIFATFDAEESGLRGSDAWAKKHGELLNELPTTVINMDSIWKPEDLQVMVSDVNCTVQLSDKLGDTLLEVAAAAGVDAKKFRMVFGGGATDAASFARVGVDAITILGLPTSAVRSNLVYHTDYDTVDSIHPAAVEATLQMIAAYVHHVDAALPMEADVRQVKKIQ